MLQAFPSQTWMTMRTLLEVAARPPFPFSQFPWVSPNTFFSFLALSFYSAASDGEAVEGDQDVIEDEDDDDEDEETDDDTDDDGSDGENEDLYAEMAMELEADNDVINGDNHYFDDSNI